MTAADADGFADRLAAIPPRPVPRLWTPRDPDLATRGPLMAAIAELAGIPLIEWQTTVADMALEIDDAGRWRHPLVVLMVARQNGKTRMLAARILTALFALDERLILHTAQDRTVPGETFEAIMDAIAATPALRRRVPKGGIRTTNGKERIRTTDGSTYRILAPRQEAFRTWSADLLVFDEAREQDDWSLWSAAVPTQRARPNPQRWVASNAGDPDSVVLNSLQDRGRAAAELPGSDPGIAFAEYSAVEGAGLDDADAVASANPALNVLITPDKVIEELLTLPEDRYRTEILCQRVTVSRATAVPADPWRKCIGEPQPFDPARTRPFLAIDIDPERTAAALVAAAWQDDRLVVELLESWTDPEAIDERVILDELRVWIKTWRPTSFGYNPATAGAIGGWLEEQAVESVKFTGPMFYTACQQLLETVGNGTLMHSGAEALTLQVLGAARREIGDGYWILSRRESDEPIPAAVALARAVYLAYTPRQKPFVA